MKREMLLFVMFVFCLVSFAFSQGNWELLHPQVTSSQMVSLDFIDTEIGLAVGEVGTILKTTDGGNSWRMITIPWNADLTDVDFVTPDIAYIVGESGIILKTEDAGESWVLQPIEFSNTLNRVRFYDAKEGGIVGETGLILRTTDGGQTWNRIITSFSYNLTGLISLSRDTWILIGAELTILRTIDSGSSWQPVSVEIPNPNYYGADDFTPLDIFFLNNEVGWLAGRVISPMSRWYDGFLYKTVDGGVTWQIVTMLEAQQICLDAASEEGGSSQVEITAGIQQIYFENESNGMCLCGPWENRTNLLYYTDDGGESWCCRMGVNHLWSGVPGRFCFLTPEKAICTYSGRGFISTIDGGRHWQGDDFWQKVPQSLIIGDDGVLTAIGLQNDISLACDESVQKLKREGIAYRSADYGKTWEEVWPQKVTAGGETVPIDKDMDIVPFRQLDLVWGIEELSDSEYALYESFDSGLTWHYQKDIVYNSYLDGIYVSGDTLIQFGFVPDAVVGTTKVIFTVDVSYDGGQTSESSQFPDLWNEVTPTYCKPDGSCFYANQLSSYHFFNCRHWIVAGRDGNIIKTTNGGKSWQNISSGVIENLQDICFVNANTGFVVGDFGRILKTENGGLTWRKTNSGTQNNIYSIVFEDELTGWAGTYRGLLYTLDGGENWAPVVGQSIKEMIGILKYDPSGNLYGYSLSLKGIGWAIFSGDATVTDGTLCLKRSGANQVTDWNDAKPEQFQLYPNYPNPFNSNTLIKYDLADGGEIELAIYNIQGKWVRKLEAGYHAAGSHTVRWDGRDQQGQVVSSGVYLIRLNSAANQQCQKMLYLR